MVLGWISFAVVPSDSIDDLPAATHLIHRMPEDFVKYKLQMEKSELLAKETKAKHDKWNAEFDAKYKKWEVEFDAKYKIWEVEFDAKYKKWEVEFDAKYKKWEVEFDAKYKNWGVEGKEKADPSKKQSATMIAGENKLHDLKRKRAREDEEAS